MRTLDKSRGRSAQAGVEVSGMDAPEVIITTTFFVSDEWSLVETADFKLRVLRNGQPVAGYEWNSASMARAVTTYRQLTEKRGDASGDKTGGMYPASGQLDV